MRRPLLIASSCLGFFALMFSFSTLSFSQGDQPTPKGKLTFASRDKSGNTDIYRVAADGSDLKRLTDHEAFDGYPTCSPDGYSIAFVSNRHVKLEGKQANSFCPGKNCDIYLMNADGSHVKRLTFNEGANYYPVWSPDGRQIAFFGHHAGTPLTGTDIFVIDAVGSNVKRVTNSGTWKNGPSWSPDGKRLAFSAYPEDQLGPKKHHGGFNYEIYVIDSDGSNLKRLTDNARGDYAPAWSPDGSKIAFLSERDGAGGVYLMDADGSNVKKLATTISNLSAWSGMNVPFSVSFDWSPDGRKIAFSTSAMQSFIMNADGSQMRQLTTLSKTAQMPVWSPDGQWIASVGSKGMTFNRDILVISADGSYLEKVASGSSVSWCSGSDNRP